MYSQEIVSFLTQMIDNFMLETGIIQKIIVDCRTKEHFIANRKLIHTHYDFYSEYQTGTQEILLLYKQSSLNLALKNMFLKLNNVWYAPNLRFNFISIALFS